VAQPVEFFAYGSLLDQRLMREMVGEWDSLSTARLPDHKLRFSRYSEEWKGATADLEPARGGSAGGSPDMWSAASSWRWTKGCGPPRHSS